MRKLNICAQIRSKNWIFNDTYETYKMLESEILGSDQIQFNQSLKVFKNFETDVAESIVLSEDNKQRAKNIVFSRTVSKDSFPNFLEL